eukprot:1147585-Pelagomonas_calceolata.AAC.1
MSTKMLEYAIFTKKIGGSQIAFLASDHPKKGSQLHPSNIFHFQKHVLAITIFMLASGIFKKKKEGHSLYKASLEISPSWGTYAGSQ